VKKIMLIEDDSIMGESLTQRLELEDISVVWCRSLLEAKNNLKNNYSAIISDVRLPDGLATEWFANLPAISRNLPWFFLTGYGSVNDAVAAVRSGAREYLTKPFDIESLIRLIHDAIDDIETIKDEVFLGISPVMRQVENTIRKVSNQKVSILLTGESGVGKEIAAKLVHALDSRATKGEFVAVNCAAIPETMLESEFFGHEKGSFTGASRQHKGYLERADHGTLFLDEVGDLPSNMQAKLLRALQEKCFFRLGAEKTTHSDFRIVAATNRDLHADMKAGSFREDLYYRLAVIKINLPPLRDRIEDIRWLTERILSEQVIEQNRPIAISENFMRFLLSREWRGNARELKSYLEQAIVMSDGGVLDTQVSINENNPTPVETDNLDNIASLHDVVEETERSYIRKVLNRCEGSLGKTAERLGISRKTLWEKMKRLNITSTVK
jgi:DNA-binding NtrC family response regulator